MSFSANVVLALLWAALIGPFSPANVLVGFLIGFAIMAIASRFGRRDPYVRRVWFTMVLVLFTIYELVIANLRVAWWTLTPIAELQPAILGIPLAEDMTDLEITLLSALITLTPGTLTLDVSPDRRTIFVHFMHTEDHAAAIASVRDGFGRLVLRATR